MFGYILGTDTICRGTFWVQTQFIGVHFGYKTKFRHQVEIFVTLEMSGFARPTFLIGGKFPYALSIILCKSKI